MGPGWSLGGHHRRVGRLEMSGFNGEGSSVQIGLEPEKSSARDAEPRGKSLEEDVMIYSVKCSRDVEEA